MYANPQKNLFHTPGCGCAALRCPCGAMHHELPELGCAPSLCVWVQVCMHVCMCVSLPPFRVRNHLVSTYVCVGFVLSNNNTKSTNAILFLQGVDLYSP